MSLHEFTFNDIMLVTWIGYNGSRDTTKVGKFNFNQGFSFLCGFFLGGRVLFPFSFSLFLPSFLPSFLSPSLPFFESQLSNWLVVALYTLLQTFPSGCMAKLVGFDFPNQGLNPCPLKWKRGVLTTGSPANSLCELNNIKEFPYTFAYKNPDFNVIRIQM